MRALPLLRPSSIALFDLCEYPWSRHAREWPAKPEHAQATFGTAISRLAECASIWGAAPTDELVATLTPSDGARFRRCAEHVIALLASESPAWRKAEVRLAWDWETDTARELARDAELNDTEIAGTLDHAHMTADGRLVVRDWKSGWRQRQMSDPTTNPQLSTYALMAARCYGASSVTVELAHVDEDGVRIDPHGMTAFDLELARSELRARIDRIGGDTSPAPGPHCKEGYCPIVSVCPATLHAMARIEQDAMVMTPHFSGAIQSHQHAIELDDRLRAIEEALPALKLRVEEYVREHGPITLADGRVWASRQHDGRERVDMGVPGAMAVLRERLGEHADLAVTLDSSKSGIQTAAKKAIGGDAKRGALKEMVEPILAELRDIGALRQGPSYERVEKFKRKD